MQSVSVVIPTNRGGRYLESAVASVNRQTTPAREIILVDDGSPAPGLEATASALGVRYIRQAASGISVARNTGVAAATGAWIAFLDDDDVWDPQRLELQLSAITRRPRAIAAYTGGWYMDAAGEKFGDGWPAPSATRDAFLAGDVPFPRITTLLVRREAYLAVGGCATLMEPAEDNDLILRLLVRGEFVGVDQQLVGYRRHDSNVTRRGLRGREASQRAVSGAVRAARGRGDQPLVELLSSNLRALRRASASENLGEFIGAARGREWRYAGRVAWWGVTSVPIESVGAVRDRLSRRP